MRSVLPDVKAAVRTVEKAGLYFRERRWNRGAVCGTGEVMLQPFGAVRKPRRLTRLDLPFPELANQKGPEMARKAELYLYMASRTMVLEDTLHG